MVGSRTPKVLVVEDSHEIAWRLHQLIHESGDLEAVGPAHDLATALRMFEETRPDAVLLDLVLPDGSGIDLVKSVRRAKSACAILVYTAVEERALHEASVRAGADGLLVKPADPDVVVGALRTALERKRSSH